MRPFNLFSPLKIFVAIGTIIVAGSAYSANWYVRPSSAGGNTGADWNNAWSLSQMNSAQGSIRPGDTVWIAGGLHNAAPLLTTSGTAAAPIKYLRVQATDAVPVAAAGWQSSFDSQAVFPNNSTLDFEANFVTVDGRVTDGFTVKWTIGGDACRLSQNCNGNNNVRILHVTLVGPYATHGPPAGYGFSWWSGGGNFGRTNNYIGYCTVRGFCEDFKFSNVSNMIIEHCLIGDTYNDSIDHEDTCFSYASQHVIWRYNTFYNSPNDGLFNYDTINVLNSNWYFYGNVVYNYINWCICTDNAGGVPCGPLFIYNNVFMSPNKGASTWISTNGLTPSGGTTYLYNNIFINAQNQMTGYGNVVSDYNAYSEADLQGSAGGPAAKEGPHSFVFSYDPSQFVHVAPPPAGGISESPNVGDATGNFRLTAAGATVFKGKGIAITPADGSLNYDADGNVRGGSGAWDIGAFQYSSGQPAPSPQPVSGLRITGS
jgi:hypothetical protein